MPCYEINLIGVEFKLKNKKILFESLKELNVNFTEYKSEINIYKRGFIEGRINLETQTAETNNMDYINKIKKLYSKKIIQQVATKKKWIFKKISENKIQLNKY